MWLGSLNFCSKLNGLVPVPNESVHHELLFEFQVENLSADEPSTKFDLKEIKKTKFEIN